MSEKPLTLQRQRKRIPFHARWARMKNGEAILASLYEDGVSLSPKAGKAYANHVETAGFRSAAIVCYGNRRDGTLRIFRHVVFPDLRLYPNETRSSLDRNFKGAELCVNGQKIKEKAKKYDFDGVLSIESEGGGLRIERKLCAAREARALIEILTIANATETELRVEVLLKDRPQFTPPEIGADRRSYLLFSEATENSFSLAPGAKKEIGTSYRAEESEPEPFDPFAELEKRRALIGELKNRALRIVTPDKEINRMAEFAKLRASESIFRTKGGLMHGPGGGGYYAALWTNDQCEYVNPLFGYLGFPTGAEQAVDCFRQFAKYAKPDAPVVSSIVAEGENVWHGAGDRGDSAMFAYGLSFFLLARGDRGAAAEFLPPLRAALDYTLSKINPDGVIESDSDELENRFESGKANLSTSCIALNALVLAATVETELGNADRADRYRRASDALKAAIPRFFHARVEGFETYRYCKEEPRLRSWICLPLLSGIADRATTTVDALLSDKLRRGAGLLTRAGGGTYWDRSTLYALRAMFAVGETERGFGLLKEYTARRLRGAHHPYAVEAYPEGNQAQLSAESGLYFRVLSEGVLGYRPAGFARAAIKPALPREWNGISVCGLRVGNAVFDLLIERDGGGYRLTVNGAPAGAFAAGEEYILEG